MPGTMKTLGRQGAASMGDSIELDLAYLAESIYAVRDAIESAEMSPIIKLPEPKITFPSPEVQINVPEVPPTPVEVNMPPIVMDPPKYDLTRPAIIAGVLVPVLNFVLELGLELLKGF